jgi:prepilin-type N-terminal cleavage/methylation domain-containing protein
MTVSRGHRAGFTLVELLVVLAVIAILAGLLLAGIQRVRDAGQRSQCLNNLRQIGLALSAYHNAHGVLPPGRAGTSPAERYPRMGWSARILPYLEQQALWEQAVRDYAANPTRPWASPVHVGLSTPVRAYSCPADPRTFASADTPVGITPDIAIRAAFTSYLGVSGIDVGRRDGCLHLESTVRFVDITDGTSHTLLVGERPPSADLVWGWWYAGVGQVDTGSADMILGVRELNVRFVIDPECPSGPTTFGPGRFTDQCDVLHFWSPHLGGGTHFLMADGSASFVGYSAAARLPALATRAGGEPAEALD